MQMPLADAIALLGVPINYTKEDVIAAFRREVKRAHPDLGGTAEMFRKLVARRAIVCWPRSAPRRRRQRCRLTMRAGRLSAIAAVAAHNAGSARRAGSPTDKCYHYDRSPDAAPALVLSSRGRLCDLVGVDRRR